MSLVSWKRPEQFRTPMSKTKKIVLGIVGGFVLLGAIGAMIDGGTKQQAAAPVSAGASVQTVEVQPSDPAPVESSSSGETSGQSNARESAEQYLQTGAFSRAGLIKQLSSQYGEGYSKADAIYAANHIDVNWNEEAAKAAKSYLDTSAFSRAGLIQQLESAYGDGFTHAQAVYGVNAAY
jgi:hypothetical protein